MEGQTSKLYITGDVHASWKKVKTSWPYFTQHKPDKGSK